jgi:hypothetical protein
MTPNEGARKMMEVICRLGGANAVQLIHPMSNPENDPLKQLLGQWKMAEPLPPRFQEQVWRRIEKREMPEAGAWELGTQWLEALFARRAVALAYIAVLLATGLTAGYASASAHQRAEKSALSAKYLQSVDPYYGAHF